MTTVKQNNVNTQPISRNKLLGVAGTGWMFDAMDVGILSFVIAALAVDWNLSSQEMGWIGSVNSIGMAVIFVNQHIANMKITVMLDACFIFSRQWIIRVNNNVSDVFSAPLLRWHGARWRTTSCVNTRFRKCRSKRAWACRCIIRKLLGSRLVSWCVNRVFRHSRLRLACGTYFNSTSGILCYLYSHKAARFTTIYCEGKC